MQVLSSLSGITFYAPSAGFAPTNSADVSSIASAYQVVSATATQLNAGTAYLTSVNETPISASRAGNAANASLATSAWYDGTGRMISSLPDEATVSGIASAYAESAASSKMDESASSSFYPTSNPSGFISGVDLSDYATTAYVDSSVSGKMDSEEMSAYLPFSAISADENSAITSINGSSVGGGGGIESISADSNFTGNGSTGSPLGLSSQIATGTWYAGDNGFRTNIKANSTSDQFDFAIGKRSNATNPAWTWYGLAALRSADGYALSQCDFIFGSMAGAASANPGIVSGDLYGISAQAHSKGELRFSLKYPSAYINISSVGNYKPQVYAYAGNTSAYISLSKRVGTASGNSSISNRALLDSTYLEFKKYYTGYIDTADTASGTSYLMTSAQMEASSIPYWNAKLDSSAIECDTASAITAIGGSSVGGGVDSATVSAIASAYQVVSSVGDDGAYITSINGSALSGVGGGGPSDPFPYVIQSGTNQRAVLLTAFQDNNANRPTLMLSGYKSSNGKWPRMMVTDYNGTTGFTHSGVLLANAYETYIGTALAGESGVKTFRMDEYSMDFLPFRVWDTSTNTWYTADLERGYYHTARYSRSGVTLSALANSGENELYSQYLNSGIYLSSTDYAYLDTAVTASGMSATASASAELNIESIHRWDGKVDQSAYDNLYSAFTALSDVISTYSGWFSELSSISAKVDNSAIGVIE